MDHLTKIVTFLTGFFTNKEQYEELSLAEKEVFPYAVHKNHQLNDKIIGLPASFIGKFIHEESYYTLQGKERFKSDIFLFTYTKTGQVQLSSMNVPKEAMNCPFDHLPMIPFEQLHQSEKFVPLVYNYKNGIFTGKSKSMFTKKTMFVLEQSLAKEQLVIKEEMFNDEKRIFGFDTAIIYKKETI